MPNFPRLLLTLNKDSRGYITNINFYYHQQVKQSPGCDNLATPRVGENLETPNLLSSKKTPGRTKMKVFPEEALPDLIRLVHANPYRKKFIAKEFSVFLQKGDTATALKRKFTLYELNTCAYYKQKIAGFYKTRTWFRMCYV